MPVTAKSPEKVYDAFLFDMDGTLLNSIAVVERMDRLGDQVRLAARGVPEDDPWHSRQRCDPASGAAWCRCRPRSAALASRGAGGCRRQRRDPGRVQFLNSLPPERWAIVTSAPAGLRGSEAAAGIPMPSVIVTVKRYHPEKPSLKAIALAPNVWVLIPVVAW